MSAIGKHNEERSFKDEEKEEKRGYGNNTYTADHIRYTNAFHVCVLDCIWILKIHLPNLASGFPDKKAIKRDDSKRLKKTGDLSIMGMKEVKIMQLNFEWDEEKNCINRRKHGISFETAAYVFCDEHYIEMYDFEHSINEERYIAIGMVGDLLFVVYTERGENIRLISARLATEKERRLYNDQDIFY